jgi:predicted acyltransferase
MISCPLKPVQLFCATFAIGCTLDDYLWHSTFSISELHWTSNARLFADCMNFKSIYKMWKPVAVRSTCLSRWAQNVIWNQFDCILIDWFLTFLGFSCSWFQNRQDTDTCTYVVCASTMTGIFPRSPRHTLR